MRTRIGRGERSESAGNSGSSMESRRSAPTGTRLLRRMSPARGGGEEAWVGLARAIAKRSGYTRAEIECYASVAFIGNNFDVMHRSLESITRIDHRMLSCIVKTE